MRNAITIIFFSRIFLVVCFVRCLWRGFCACIVIVIVVVVAMLFFFAIAITMKEQ